MYEVKQIENAKQALTTKLLLSSTNMNTIRSTRSWKENDKVANKYNNALPTTGRLTGIREAMQQLEPK